MLARLFFIVSVSFSTCHLTVFLPVRYLLSVYLESIWPSVCLSICLSVCQSVCQNVCLSVCLSVILPVCLSPVYLAGLFGRLSICCQFIKKCCTFITKWVNTMILQNALFSAKFRSEQSHSWNYEYKPSRD